MTWPVLLALAGLLGGVAGVAAPFGDFLGSITILDGVVAGAGGITTVVVVRWLVKRAAPTLVTTESTTAATVSSTASLSGSSATKSDVAFTLPAVLPVSKGIRQVSHHEVHAFELGLIVGLVVTWLYSTGSTAPVVTIVVAFVAGTLGYKRYSSTAFRTTRHEPWYALTAMALGCGISYAVFVAELAPL